jgi:hypothetical protein
MLSDRPFANTDPIRLSVHAPKGPRSFSAEDLQRIKREINAEFPDAAQRDNAIQAAPAQENNEPPPPEPLPEPDAKIVDSPPVTSPAQLPPTSDPSPPLRCARGGRGAEGADAVRARWRNACDWLELFRICRQARCRHAGRCRGEPVGCLRAGVRHAPQPARDFVRAMMQAQDQGLSFEEAFEDLAELHDGYFGWLAGLAAARQRSRR